MYKKILGFVLLVLPASAEAVSLVNPLKARNIPELINYIVKGILGVVGALALFYLVWGGIMWMTSGGNSEKVKKGKDSIVWAIFGLGIIFFSYAVLSLVFQALGTSDAS